MSREDALSVRALILAPNGRDASLSVALRKEVGVRADICANLGQLIAELQQGAGLAIIADEALHGADVRPLVELLGAQPPWSDMPII